ncbi:MAG: nicotinate-nucleotide adenylyltransferase [Candidatus Azotimanducaceae bacterium]|jgi:nicotinate-nucleotide adenylyltransferase
MGLAIFGGTFDPVHFGHLRSAVEVCQALQVEQVRLVPAFMPVHRVAPGCSAEQRLEMLQLGIADTALLRVDDREIRRGGRSYMIDTLNSIRAEIGQGEPLSLVLGADAFNVIHEWHRWRELLDVAHLVVLGRPENPIDVNADVAAWMQDSLAEAEKLQSCPAGLICELRLTQLAISATTIRHLVGAGEPIEYLLPERVIDYIRREALYRE